MEIYVIQDGQSKQKPANQLKLTRPFSRKAGKCFKWAKNVTNDTKISFIPAEPGATQDMPAGQTPWSQCPIFPDQKFAIRRQRRRQLHRLDPQPALRPPAYEPLFADGAPAMADWEQTRIQADPRFCQNAKWSQRPGNAAAACE